MDHSTVRHSHRVWRRFILDSVPNEQELPRPSAHRQLHAVSIKDLVEHGGALHLEVDLSSGNIVVHGDVDSAHADFFFWTYTQFCDSFVSCQEYGVGMVRENNGRNKVSTDTVRNKGGC